VSHQASRKEQFVSRLLHRHRKFLASTVLGIWAFAVFVGVANACIWDGVTAAAHLPTTAAHADADATDQGIAPHCEQPGSNAVPLLGALQWVQDPAAGHPLVLAAIHDLGFPPISASRLRLARNAHPPPGVPFSLRTVRLTL
jgi:hypothetical protein